MTQKLVALCRIVDAWHGDAVDGSLTDHVRFLPAKEATWPHTGQHDGIDLFRGSRAACGK